MAGVFKQRTRIFFNVIYIVLGRQRPYNYYIIFIILIPGDLKYQLSEFCAMHMVVTDKLLDAILAYLAMDIC